MARPSAACTCVHRRQTGTGNGDGLRLTGVGRAPHSITQMTTTSGLEILRQQLQHLLAHAPQKLCTPRRALVIAQESGLVANVQ